MNFESQLLLVHSKHLKPVMKELTFWIFFSDQANLDYSTGWLWVPGRFKVPWPWSTYFTTARNLHISFEISLSTPFQSISYAILIEHTKYYNKAHQTFQLSTPILSQGNPKHHPWDNVYTFSTKFIFYINILVVKFLLQYTSSTSINSCHDGGQKSFSFNWPIFWTLQHTLIIWEGYLPSIDPMYNFTLYVNHSLISPMYSFTLYVNHSLISPLPYILSSTPRRNFESTCNWNISWFLIT